MDNILLELDESMRWERVEKFWKANGNYVLAFVALTILGTAVMSGWHAWNDYVRAKDTDHLIALLQDEHFPDNLTPAALHMRAPLRGMALINAGAHDLEGGKTDQALKFFSQAADDRSIPRDIRHLAILMKARVIGADAKSKTDLLEILGPVLKDRKSPWQCYALLEAAAFVATRHDDFTTARFYLKQVTDKEGLTSSIYAKAKALDLVYATRQQQQDKQKTGQGS